MKRLTPEQLAALARYGFDPDQFAGWQEAVKTGTLSQANNVVRGELRVPPAGAIKDLPPDATKEWRTLQKLGADAIRNGELGIVILNGGMATRFGGVVKGIVDVLGPGRSFLALAFHDVVRAQQRFGGRVQVYLMNSFATDAVTKAHLAEHDHFGLEPEQVHHFTQFISVRMERDGELFHTVSGGVSPYGPGHGDFASALRASGCLRSFLAGGGTCLLVRNVDNLGARVSDVILGHHLQSGAEVTVELAPKRPEDVGGSPFLLDGRTQLVEQVRYPDGFHGEVVDVFNCNTFTFRAAALDRDFALGRYYVEKNVEGRRTVQIEQLIGEMTRFLTGNFLRVPRSGANTRFLPVKTPDDLASARREILELYGDSPA